MISGPFARKIESVVAAGRSKKTSDVHLVGQLGSALRIQTGKVMYLLPSAY